MKGIFMGWLVLQADKNEDFIVEHDDELLIARVFLHGTKIRMGFLGSDRFQVRRQLRGLDGVAARRAVGEKYHEKDQT